MKLSNTSVSAIELQRHLFASSLFREMDDLEKKADERNASVFKTAKNYIDDGFSNDDCVDLLILDGYSSQLAKECVASCSQPVSHSKEAEQTWDYTFRDSNGKMWSSREVDQPVVASSEEEAIKIAKMIISDGDESSAQIIEIKKSNE